MDDRDPKRMPVRAFREGGYLQEVNRRLLHPLGLALEVTVVDEPVTLLRLPETTGARLRALLKEHAARAGLADLERLLDDAETLEAGDGYLSGVWDGRDDPEGWVFGDGELDAEKARGVTDELHFVAFARMAALGYVVQPVEPTAKPTAPPESP